MKASIALGLMACAALIVTARPAVAATQTVAAGTIMQGALNQSLNSASAYVGQHFSAQLKPPYPNSDSTTWSGAKVSAHVTYVQKAGQGKKPGIGFVFDNITLRNGASRHLYADFVSVDRKQSSNLGYVAATTVGGMIAGNILGKWLGTNAGGSVGAVAGALYGLNHKTDFSLPSGAKVVFELTRPLTVNTIASTTRLAAAKPHRTR